jgi:outer membrane protein assembly complex protein YaeT
VAFAVATATPACHPISPKPIPANPSITISEIQFSGFDVLTPSEIEELRDRIALKPGKLLTEAAEQAAGNTVVETLQNRGYPYAQVRIARTDTGAGGARLVVEAEPGPRGLFGSIDIAGNTRVDDTIIRRRITYKPGDLFRRSALERTQQQIAALDLFKSVKIDAQNIDQQPAEVPTLITVEEQNPWRWNLSAGYAAGERLSFEARIRNMNFLGSARQLELLGRVSRIDRLEEITFTQPDVWRPGVSLSLQGRNWTIDDPAFRALSRGGQGALTWFWNPRLSSTLAYGASFERGRISGALDPLTGLQDGTLSAWSIDVDHRTPDVERAAPSGRVLMVHLEQAGGWMPGTFNYYSVIGEARHYHTVRNRITFAHRMRYGSISAMSQETDIPLLKRFFLGGSGEMRAWSRYEVSPLSPSGEPVGGKSLLVATSEARFPLFPRLRGAIFVEAGNVWRSDWAAHVDDLRFDAGPGLRVETPFGLIRIDAGYQLNRVPDLRIDGRPQRRAWRINIGLGEAF